MEILDLPTDSREWNKTESWHGLVWQDSWELTTGIHWYQNDTRKTWSASMTWRLRLCIGSGAKIRVGALVPWCLGASYVRNNIYTVYIYIMYYTHIYTHTYIYIYIMYIYLDIMHWVKPAMRGHVLNTVWLEFGASNRSKTGLTRSRWPRWPRWPKCPMIKFEDVRIVIPCAMIQTGRALIQDDPRTSNACRIRKSYPLQPLHSLDLFGVLGITP